MSDSEWSQALVILESVNVGMLLALRKLQGWPDTATDRSDQVQSRRDRLDAVVGEQCRLHGHRSGSIGLLRWP